MSFDPSSTHSYLSVSLSLSLSLSLYFSLALSPQYPRGRCRVVTCGCWNPRPSTLNPQPSTLNPQPSTLNPQPSILNPQPSPWWPCWFPALSGRLKFTVRRHQFDKVSLLRAALNAFIYLLLSPSLSFSLAHSLSLSLTHTLFLCLSLSHTHTLSLSHTHTAVPARWVACAERVDEVWVPTEWHLEVPPQIRRESIAKANFPNFRGNQRQKWIQLT